jgi:hypothetical protein
MRTRGTTFVHTTPAQHATHTHIHSHTHNSPYTLNPTTTRGYGRGGELSLGQTVQATIGKREMMG